MSLRHYRIASLPSQAIFEALRYLGQYASAYIEQGKKEGHWPPPLVSFHGAPPSEKVARLLLHIAMEDKNLALNAHLAFYLFAHGVALRAIDTPPNTNGWENAATHIMAAMDNRIQVYYDEDKWEIICSTEIRQVKEIRDLINTIKPNDVKTSWKNIIYGSSITAERVIVGDQINVNALTAQQIQAFATIVEAMIRQGLLLQAMQAVLGFTQFQFPSVHQATQQIMDEFHIWQRKRVGGELSEAELSHDWQHLNMQMLGVIQKIIPKNET